MKRLFPLVLILALSINANAQNKHKKPKETKDSNVFDITKNQGTFLEYETPAELHSKFDKEAKLKLYSPEQLAQELEKLPKGGQLVLTFSRLSIDAANSKWFTIIIQDPHGKETFRQELDSKVPSPFNGGSITYWKNIRVISLSNNIPTGSTVFVIDELGKSRFEYLVKND